jgi:hypothetical protein
MPVGVSPSGIANACAKLAWLTPLSVMVVVGFAEQGGRWLPFSSETLVSFAILAALLGILLGLIALLHISRGNLGLPKRHALLGIGAGAALLLVAQAGAVAGARSRADFEPMVQAALRDYAGFNGGVLIEGAAVSIVQIDEHSALGKFLLEPFQHSFPLLLVGVDNSAGASDLVLDLDAARVLLRDGVKPVLSRREMSTEARRGTDERLQHHLGTYTVPMGMRLDDALLLLPGPDPMPSARGVELTVNGARIKIPGRYFTLADKRAIDAAR